MSAQIAESLNSKASASAVNSNVEVIHEQDTQAFYEIDVLSQFRTNLNQLEELNARLHFMMNEVAGLVKK